MGLWKQIMKMNQQVWKNMESLEEQDQEKELSNGSEKVTNHIDTNLFSYLFRYLIEIYVYTTVK
jgi:hypothetical protein